MCGCGSIQEWYDLFSGVELSIRSFCFVWDKLVLIDCRRLYFVRYIVMFYICIYYNTFGH